MYTERKSNIYLFSLLLPLLLLLLLLPLPVVAAFYAKINHKAPQPVQSVRLVFNFFFSDLCAHLNLHLATTKHSFTQSPLCLHSPLFLPATSTPLNLHFSFAAAVCQFRAFKVKHLKRHTLRMINMNATHLQSIYYSTHMHTHISHNYWYYSCTIVAAFFLPYLRWIWRFDLR